MSIYAHIVEEGSVSAAANKLELSKSVISQHLKALEQELGMTLIKRTTRRQTLTEAGEQFYVSCRDINTIASNAFEQMQKARTEPSGRLRITAPNALMEFLVVPVVTALMQQYPKLKPELISDDHHLDLMKNDIDVAIRVGHSKDSGLKQKRLGEFRDVLCGIAAFKHQNIEDIPYIANQWQSRLIKHRFTAKDGTQYDYEKSVDCQANTFHSCQALIRAGAGIGIIPDFYLPQIEHEVVRLLEDLSLPANTVYALSPFTKAPPLAIKLCTDAIGKRLSAQV